MRSVLMNIKDVNELLNIRNHKVIEVVLLMRVHTKPLYDHILPKLVAVDNKSTLQIHIC